MSIKNFVTVWHKALSPNESNAALESAARAIGDQLLDTTRKLEARSKRHKEERERGARVTKHRISV